MHLMLNSVGIPVCLYPTYYEILTDKISTTSLMNAGFVEYVDGTMISERSRALNRPIYLVGGDTDTTPNVGTQAHNIVF